MSVVVSQPRDNPPGPSGTHKLVLNGVTMDASNDPAVEARGRAALQRLSDQPSSPGPRLSKTEYAKTTTAAGYNSVMAARQNTDSTQ